MPAKDPSQSSSEKSRGVVFAFAAGVALGLAIAFPFIRSPQQIQNGRAPRENQTKVQPEDTPRDTPPKSFAYETCEGYEDERLDIVGGIQDESMPRQWMITEEDGAESQLGGGTTKHWLLSEPFRDGYREFTLTVNTGTGSELYISAYLLDDANKYKRVALTNKPHMGKSTKYKFEVPVSSKGDRLLVYVALKNGVFESMKHDPRFRLYYDP